MDKQHKRKKTIRVFEAFAGYGGASYGLKRSGIKYKVIGFSEIEESADLILYHNFPNIENYGDIKIIRAKLEKNPKEIPDFDLFTGGFPCQPFSSAGLMQGEEDKLGRGTLIYEIIRICQIKKPKYILLENVRGLLGKKHRATFQKILSELHRIGYDVRYAVLNSKDYGIPQTRDRLWIFGYKGILPDKFEIVPPVLESELRLKDFLDQNPDPELYRSEAQIKRIHEIHHNDTFDVKEPLCYDIYNRKIRYDGLCMTITPPEHNVIRIIEPMVDGKERFRKLSLDEHFRFMGFILNENEREIKFPPSQNYTKLGRRAGNGWDVNLVGILIKHIFSQL